jgi:hypothetical protein
VATVQRLANVSDSQGVPYSGELAVFYMREHWIAPVVQQHRETFPVVNGIALIRIPYKDDVAFILQRPPGGSKSLSKDEIKNGGNFRLYGKPLSDGTPRLSSYVLTLTKP